MKLYLDTSIFGGYFEAEFKLWTEKLIDEILDGNYTAVIADLTLAELETAPVRVKTLADRVIQTNSIFLPLIQAASNSQINILRRKLLLPNTGLMPCILPPPPLIMPT